MTPPVHSRWPVALSGLLFALALAACGDGADEVRTRLHTVSVGGHDDGGLEGGLDDELDSCADAGVGEPCGPVHHCIDGVCLPNRCGDGVQAGLEECDDGNEIAGDECNPACRATPFSCGDGSINDDREECDDGNTAEDDLCSTGCTLNVCGNGRKDFGEECDDANDVNDDECSNTCTQNRCRNGRLDPGEECDDGNRLNDDGCTNACVSVRCGDKETYPAFEECDDGNTVDDDGCSNQCKLNVCGNNRIDVHEVCDGSALPEGTSGVCKTDCSGATSIDACDPCRRQDNNCTDYLGSGINLVDSCLTLGPEGTGPDFADRCAALSVCITQSRCDLVDPEIRVGCYCGAGNSLTDCQNEVAPANGPCVDEFLAATGCGDQAKPTQCVINLAGDLTLPAGYAVYLAECDRTYCSAECRPQ